MQKLKRLEQVSGDMKIVDHKSLEQVYATAKICSI